MKFKEFYNPRHVYDGFFETYFIRPFFHHFADFNGKESGPSCLKSLLAWIIVTLGITGIMMGQIGLLGPEVGSTALTTVAVLWGAFSLIPILALIVRASHGSPDKKLHPRVLGVDALLGVSCLLFCLLGLLMMITTLNSGQLNPNAGMTDELDTLRVEEVYVKEEPIFTYQDELPVQTEEQPDSLSDMNETDLADPDESFDPTLTDPRQVEDLIEQPASDSI